MRYIVEPGTPLYDELQAFQARLRAARKATFALCEELGAGDKVLLSSGYLAGGIIGFEFNQQPEGWKRSHRDHWNCFYPKALKQNKEILAKIAALPEVKRNEVNKIIGFREQFVGNYFIRNVGVHWSDTFVLIQISEDAEYEPKEGMREITVSEYKRLSETQPQTAPEP